jgi:protein ImuB
MPVVACFIPAFSIAVARSLAVDPPPVHAPVLLADKLERGRVQAVSAAAAALGARAGMTLLQAHACAREAVTLLDQPGRVREAWDAFLDALDAASPLIEDGGPGTAFLDMRGIEGPPARWLAGAGEIAAATARELGLDLVDVRLGAGPNRFTARAAATADPRAARAEAGICRPEEAAAMLAPLPLALLDLDPATRERLHLLGITTLGELAALPHGPFVRRFGARAMRWHALARGIDDAPLVPRPRAVRIERARYGEGSAHSEEAVLFALRTLVERVADDVALTGKRAARLVLSLECEDAETATIEATIAQPTARASTMFDLLRARLEGIVVRAPVNGLRLRAEGLETGSAQGSLFASGDPDPDAVALALARLEAAFGVIAQRLRVEEGYRFERRTGTEPFDPALGGSPRNAGAPPEHGWFAPSHLRAAGGASARATLQFRPHAPRPVDVTTCAGVPAFVGTPPQTVRDCAGPWRTAETWWTGARASDDYDVLLEDGALVRLTRVTRSGTCWFATGTYD